MRKARKGRGIARQPGSGQVSTFLCPGQQAQQHLKPAQAALKEDTAQEASQQGGRGTEAPDPWECDLEDRAALRLLRRQLDR